CNRSGFAKQPRQAAQIQHDLRGAAYLDSRRELTRHRRQHIRRSTFYRRQRTNHRTPPARRTSLEPSRASTSNFQLPTSNAKSQSKQLGSWELDLGSCFIAAYGVTARTRT